MTENHIERGQEQSGREGVTLKDVVKPPLTGGRRVGYESPVQYRDAKMELLSDEELPQADGMIKKIMIVDDEDLIRHTLSKVFRNSSTETLALSDGDAAFTVLKHARVDLCFIDIHLPGMSGLEIMKKVRELYPRTRIIIISGNVLTPAVMQSIRENADCMISKPFDLRQVKAVVQRLLAKDRHELGEHDRVIAGDESSVAWIAESYQ